MTKAAVAKAWTYYEWADGVHRPYEEPESDTTSDLAIAAAALSSGQSASFSDGIQTTLAANELEWQTRALFDATHRTVHLFGKAAGESAAYRHQYFDIATSTWTTTNPNFADFGHAYGNTADDPATGDVFLVPGGFVDATVALWWQRATATWAVAPGSGVLNVDDVALNDTANGIAWHPNLFGAGDGGLIVGQQLATFIWRKSTDAMLSIGHGSSDYGTKEGIGLYWPSQDCALIGGSSGGSGQLLRVDVAVGGTPQLSALSVPPISTAGHSAENSTNFGSLHVHPGDPTKLLLLASPASDDRAWEGALVSGDISWSAISGGHPYTVSPRVPASMTGYGVMWGIARDRSTEANSSVLWKP